MNTIVDPNKSCFGCPSLLSSDEAAVFFRKSVGQGVPICSRYGKVIGNVNSDDDQRRVVAKTIAKSCPDHGQQKPASPDWNRAKFIVALPDPTVLGAAQNRPELVSSCGACTNFVREDVVASQLGWSTGLCAAKGKLLLGNRYTYEATGCEYKSQGTVRTDVGSLTMVPEYQEDFKPTGDPVKNYFRQRQLGFVDPTQYETDKEVSTADAARGIRAWRKVLDPNSGNSVHLPIYRIDYFSEEEQVKIPRTGDDEHPEDYVDHAFLTYTVAVLWMELDETPGLWGVPGTGKTEFFRYMAWLMCLPFERFNITNSTELEDLAGRPHFSPEKGTYFTDGRFTRAWQKPGVIDVDEPNTGPPDVWQFFRPLTDNSKQFVLDMDSGRRVERDNDCFLGMAMNPAWDARNVGAHMISDADANRLMHMFIELPPPELEREILRTACMRDGYEISNDKIKTIMNIAADLRALEETLSISWALRPQIKVARASKWFDWLKAYRLASGDFLEPEAQQQLLDVVRSHTA